MHNQYLAAPNTVCGRLAQVDQPLALGTGSQQIHGVTRADIPTLAWLAPLAGVLAFWWLFRADPCLDNEIGQYLSAMNRPVTQSSVLTLRLHPRA